jgi:hypothetical protein
MCPNPNYCATYFYARAAESRERTCEGKEHLAVCLQAAVVVVAMLKKKTIKCRHSQMMTRLTPLTIQKVCHQYLVNPHFQGFFLWLKICNNKIMLKVS